MAIAPIAPARTEHVRARVVETRGRILCELRQAREVSSGQGMGWHWQAQAVTTKYTGSLGLGRAAFKFPQPRGPGEANSSMRGTSLCWRGRRLPVSSEGRAVTVPTLVL